MFRYSGWLPDDTNEPRAGVTRWPRRLARRLHSMLDGRLASWLGAKRLRPHSPLPYRTLHAAKSRHADIRTITVKNTVSQANTPIAPHSDTGWMRRSDTRSWIAGKDRRSRLLIGLIAGYG